MMWLLIWFGLGLLYTLALAQTLMETMITRFINRNKINAQGLCCVLSWVIFYYEYVTLFHPELFK